MAKYVMTWEPRDGGGAAAQEESLKRGLAVFSQWTPSEEVRFDQFVSRADGEGGFAVVRSKKVESVMREMAKFVPYFEFHLYPVIDVAEGAAISSEAIEFRDSIS